MNVTPASVSRAIQEFASLTGFRYGAMVCEKCGNEKNKPGWYHGVTIQHPCVECGGRLKFDDRPWVPTVYKEMSADADSKPKATRTRRKK
jgi:hypothetical protein